jgi:hypothetical protein
MFEMSLPTGQQRVLESIEGKLAESDPRLVSLFSIFTRLTLTEKMPWIEQVAVRPVADRLAALAYWFRWTARRPAARVRAMVLLPAALTAVACTLTTCRGARPPLRGNWSSSPVTWWPGPACAGR